jgi:hypothetical protein
MWSCQYICNKTSPLCLCIACMLCFVITLIILLLDTWLEAYRCMFASILTAVKPRLVSDIFRYQFQPHVWLQLLYDIQFRLKKSSNPGISWSTADPELTATWLSADIILPKINSISVGKSAGLCCPVCNSDGHTAHSCPTLASNSQKSKFFHHPVITKLSLTTKFTSLFSRHKRRPRASLPLSQYT